MTPGDVPFQRRLDRAIARFDLRREEIRARKKAQADVEKKRAAKQAADAERAESERVQSEAQAEEDKKLAEIADTARKEEDERRAADRARRAEEKARRDEEKKKRDEEKAAARAAKDAEAQDNLRRLEEAAVRLESLAESTDKKTVESALKSAHDVVNTVGSNLPKEGGKAARERYDAARAKLVIRERELRETEDWKRWANVPMLEALCAKMEALLTVEDLKDVQAQLKALQAEWKTVGAAPKEKSEALWKRFKAAGDQVYERTKPLRAERDAARAESIGKKEELCKKLDELVAIADADMSWKETSEKVKALQEEWKTTGRVRRDEGDELWKRFRGKCDEFFDRRKKHWEERDEARGENLKRYEALCEKAEALSQSSDWKRTADELKALQAEWKSVGPAPKAEGDAVWNRFRAACDAFFDRRKAQFAEADAEREENLKKKLLLCEKVEALLAAEDRDAAKGECKKLQAEWKTIGPAPKAEADAVWGRFRNACDKLFDRDREVEEPPPPPAPDAPKFGNRALADKLAALKPEEPAVPAKAEEPPPAPTESLSGAKQQLEAAASEWEDIATGVGPDPLKGK
jgi:hypothetical protein